MSVLRMNALLLASIVSLTGGELPPYTLPEISNIIYWFPASPEIVTLDISYFTPDIVKYHWSERSFTPVTPPGGDNNSLFSFP